MSAQVPELLQVEDGWIVRYGELVSVSWTQLQPSYRRGVRADVSVTLHRPGAEPETLDWDHGWLISSSNARGVFADKLEDRLPAFGWHEALSIGAELVIKAWRERPASQVQRWTAAELLRADFPAPKWVAANLLPEGLTACGGRPKRGKSWLALQAAVAISEGGDFLGESVAKGVALYYGLEDPPRRIQARLMALGCTPRDNLHIRLGLPLLTDGGFDYMEREIADLKPALVVLDTVSRALGLGEDQLDAAQMNETYGRLHGLVLHGAGSLLVIDHLTKGVTGDPTRDMLGATAKAAVPDTIWGVYREKGRPEGVLAITGRDVEDIELALSFDPSRGECWQLRGEVTDIGREGARGNLLFVVEELGECTAAAIADELGLGRAAVHEQLQKLREAGLVTTRRKFNGGRGRPEIAYQLTGTRAGRVDESA